MCSTLSNVLFNVLFNVVRYPSLPYLLPLQSVYTAARVIRLDGKAAVMDETGLAGVLSR